MLYKREIAEKLLDKFDQDKSLYLKMRDYYNGNTDAFNNYPKTDRSNRKVRTNHVKMFIDEEVAYLTGNKLTYLSTSKKSKVIKDIEYNINNINSCLDTELTTTLLTYGVAYELYYLYEEEFKARVVSPLNGIALTNAENKVELFLYFYTKDLDDTEYIDVYDESNIYHLDKDFNTVAPATKHYFGVCPVGIAKLNNGTNDTIYNSIKDLQDSYESTLSDWSNEIADTRLAYLLITGMQLDEETAANMKKMGILQCSDPHGQINWLVKNIPSDFVLNYRATLEEEMYKVTHHLKNQVALQSNTSGSMLATRLNCLRIKLTAVHQCLSN